MHRPPPQPGRAPTPANRFALDYRAEALRLGPPPTPITDVHTHVNGERASKIYAEAARLFGVERVYSMTRLEDAQHVRAALGDRVRFIAVPNFMRPDGGRAFREGFLEDIHAFHALGARILKFWSAPRALDFGRELGDPALMTFDSPWRERAMELGASLGMMFMTHVADPDTWFQTKYADASSYGTKASQYAPLERALERFPAPWIAAHMGGWPERLDFLDGLLERHDNLHLDTSATKWMLRELSRHPGDRLLAFLERWRGRVFFGSDIVTTDQHLTHEAGPRGMGLLAASEGEAFDLYASRYYALRTMWETRYEGESPIADPDLMLVDPGAYNEMSAPILRGRSLPPDLLRPLYHDSAASVVDRWHDEHP